MKRLVSSSDDLKWTMISETEENLADEHQSASGKLVFFFRLDVSETFYNNIHVSTCPADLRKQPEARILITCTWVAHEYQSQLQITLVGITTRNQGDEGRL